MSFVSDMEVTYVPVSNPERKQLEQADERTLVWMQCLRNEAEGINDEHLERFERTTRGCVARFDENLPPTLDPEALAEIRGILLDVIRGLDKEAAERAGPLDMVDGLMVSLESIRQILRDILDEDIGKGSDAKALTEQLVEWLPGITQKQLAHLLNVSEKTFQRWRAGGGPPRRRLEIVTRLVALLRRGWTPHGVLAWFGRPREDLDGRTPIDLLDDPAAERELMDAARFGRAGHGA
jgi:hypothetical protein